MTYARNRNESRETYHIGRGQTFSVDTPEEIERKRALWPWSHHCVRNGLKNKVTRAKLISCGSKSCCGVGWRCENLTGRVCKKYERSIRSNRKRLVDCLIDESREAVEAK